MASVNRLVVLNGSVAADANNAVVESFSPASGERIETVGLFTNANTNIDYTILLNETTLIDAVPGEDLPTGDNPLRYEITLEPGDEVTLQADNNDTGAAQDARIVFMSEDTALPG
jgi:hypothetical protein